MSSDNVHSFFDIDVLRKSSFDDDENMKEFLNLLIEAIDKVEINIRQAIKRTSRKELLINMHTIKSNFRICGFVLLFHVAKNLEHDLNENSSIDVSEINSFVEMMHEARKTCIRELSVLKQ